MKMLDLVHPMYRKTASHGHFGRKPRKVKKGRETWTEFSWEETDLADALRDAAGI